MRGVRSIVALGLVLSLIILISLAMPYLAQETISVPNCGYVTVYPSDSYGNIKTTFVTGDFVYLTLRSQYTCTVTLTVTLRDPTGGVTTIINNQQQYLPANTNVVISLFQVTPANPSGQWTIYATLSGVGAPPMVIEVNPPPPPPPPCPICLILPWLIIVIVAAIIGILAVVLMRRRAEEERTRVLPAPVQQAQPAPERERTKVGVILYRLRLPNGMEIPVSEPYRVFGRETFERYGLPKDVLDFITREDRGGHFKIYLRGMKWFIEDSGSTNGTLLNGVEIRGKGPQELKDSDVISPGGVVNLVFQLEKAEVK
jgi:hypothetical protein